MTSTPIEVWEALTSTTVERKALLIDSGGPGRNRGGLGQELAIRNDSGHLMTVSCLGACTEFPPLGIRGGKPGQRRQYRVNGEEVHPKGRYVLRPSEVISTIEPGGGGSGDPHDRPVERVLEDVREGFVSVEAALRDYGVMVDPQRGRAWRP